MDTIAFEDKKKIVARNFFTDNRDQYKDYTEALRDMEDLPSEFIELATEPYIKRKPGCYLMMNDVGHVASVRSSDGFFEPLTEMTEEEGKEIEKAFQAEADLKKDISGIRMLQNIGWKIL